MSTRILRLGRRGVVLAAILGMVAALLVVAAPPPTADATPVAPAEELVPILGRVFPDPHGCIEPGTPTKSPHAKGNVCAAQFIQWDEAIDGVKLLAHLYPRYIQVINLNEQYGDHDAFVGEDFRSAGLPQEDLSRDRQDLYLVKVTDRESAVPEAERRHFVYSLAIHGIERAGLEGGLRAAEDLAVWAACENGDDVVLDCADEGAEDGRRLLDPFDEEGRSPTAGEALANGVVYLTLSNPDGWARGDYSQGGIFYQRYNGHGMDLNRDWPTVGYSDPAYTSWSEPETRGFGRWLKWVSDNHTADGHFAGGIDLHGMVTASALSYTLLGAGQKDYRKNEISVDTATLMWRDAEERLTWSPHVAQAEDCPGPIPEPFFGQGRTQGPMCTVQWGTVWDTIEYQVTGGMGDWIDNPEIGLGGVGINNEMALSHLAPNNIFEPDIVQLQVEGNKSLIYSQISALLFEDEIAYEPGGRIAYVDDPSRVSHDGEGFAVDPELYDLPTQGDIEGLELTGAQGFEFVVHDHHSGDVYNGGMTIEATFGNVRGISPNAVAALTLEYCGRTDDRQAHQHSHEVGAMSEHDEDCEEIASYFNQAPTYAQAGAQIELNRPEQGLYRISTNAARVAPTNYHVRFSRDDAIPGWDEQAAYDVSRIDFFRELNEFVAADGDELVGLSVERITDDPQVLMTFDTVVIADRFQPQDGDDGAYAEALRSFVESGGNLVLTDGALEGLSEVAGLPADSISRGTFYAGYIDFNDGDEPTFGTHPLTEDVEKDGTASGRQTLQGTAYHDRRQTYEPVPIGYLVGGPTTCTSGCDAPNWVVDQATWEDAGGTALGRTFVRPGPQGGSGWDGVSLGELALGEGVVRIIGGLLPEPTQDNFHPYGLSSYALTYTGYQLFENAATWENPNREEPRDPTDPDDPVEPGVVLECVGDCVVEVRAGESGETQLTIENTGGETATFVLAVDRAPDRTEARVEPETVELEAGASEVVTLTVDTARNARHGTHDVDVSATSDEAVDTETVELTITRGQPSHAGGPGGGQGAVAGIAEGIPGGAAGLTLLLIALIGAGVAGVRSRARSDGGAA